MKGYFLFGFLLVQVVGSSQLTRREIIERKIVSVEMVVYNNAGKKMNVQKNYYSLRGSDSLTINNDNSLFRFKEELDDKGRVQQLKRYNERGQDDELHVFEYNDTGYTIEVIAHGAGTIFFTTYNNKHDCIEEVQSSTDTFYYSNNELGKVEKITQKDSGVMKDILVTETDAKGFPVVIRLMNGSPYLTRLVYNEQGLPAEVKRMKLDNAQEQLVLRTVYIYKFRGN